MSRQRTYDQNPIDDRDYPSHPIPPANLSPHRTPGAYRQQSYSLSDSPYHDEYGAVEGLTPPPRLTSPFAEQPLYSRANYNSSALSLDPDQHRDPVGEGYYPNQDESYPLTQYPSHYPPTPMYDNNQTIYESQDFAGAFEGGTGDGSEVDLSRFGRYNEETRPQRSKTIKRIELYRGNLVLDCPVPNRLLSSLANNSEREFTHMRYSAATCDPGDFMRENFTLRQVLYSQPRATELFIVITMYNEDEVLFCRTMSGVMKNISHLCSRDRSKIWGKEGWKKVVVCVVSDGRQKINPRTLSVLAGMGVYQDGIAKNVVNGKPVTAHIYEYTTQVSVSSDVKFKRGERSTVPVQILFCLKEKNQKKINSHRWFFQAFGSILQPNICVLIDAGTKPSGTAIYHLWKAFDLNRNVAGACGEIKAMIGTGGKALLNPIVATQNFEYKMSNILDKPLESVFGFISVLPGAFSAYRYIALQNDVTGQGPLEKYFKGETLHGASAGIFTSNMYLAEDRILCFELVSKRKARWVLQYVKSSVAETDVPAELSELILQRRRWLNGSFFAAMYALVHAFQIWRSDHSFLRKLMLNIEFFYQFLNILFSWFAIGNFFLVFRILTVSLGDPADNFAPGTVLSIVFEWLYIASLATCFILSMGNRPQGTKLWYSIMAGFWAVLMGYLLFAAIFLSIKAVQGALETNGGQITASLFLNNSIFRNLVVSLCSTYLLYFLASFLFFEPWHMFTSVGFYWDITNYSSYNTFSCHLLTSTY